MDGTLVDTERVWFQAEQAAVARLGGALPAAAEASLLGLDTNTLVARLSTGYGVNGTPAALRAAIEVEVESRLATAPACAGADALVEAALRRGVRCAVVSNSPAVFVRESLAPHAWASSLTLRVTADDVVHPKPAPDLYLLALTRLGLAAHECVALEDSPTGVRAALAAGLTCVGVAADDEQRAELARITPHVVASLDDARRWLALDETAASPSSP
jgi:HAD superfamily hydrolase (TIGR01509 family)